MKRLENLVRRYATYKGLYIDKDQEIKELEGCFYKPLLGNINPVTETQQTRFRRLINWALG